MTELVTFEAVCYYAAAATIALVAAAWCAVAASCRAARAQEHCRDLARRYVQAVDDRREVRGQLAEVESKFGVLTFALRKALFAATGLEDYAVDDEDEDEDEDDGEDD